MIDIQKAIEVSEKPSAIQFEERTGLKLASLGKRVGAAAIDLTIASVLFVIFLIIAFIVAIVLTETSIGTDYEAGMLFALLFGFIPAIILIGLISSVLYFIPELMKGRASLGKRMLGIHWVGENGEPLKKSSAWFHVFLVMFLWIALVAMINSFTFFLGFVLPIALYIGASQNKNKQTLYDEWSHAYLVEKR